MAADGYLTTTSNKQINTYLFQIDGFLADTSAIGIFNINQDYTGNGLILNGVSFRDEENYDLEYALPLSETFNFTLQNYGEYVSDKRSNTSSELFRIGGMLGFEFSNQVQDKKKFLGLIDNYAGQLKAGIENNERLGLVSPGYRGVGQLLMNTDFSGATFLISTDNDYLSLNLDRENLESRNLLSYTETYSPGNIMHIDVKMDVLDRDLLGRTTEAQRIDNPGEFYKVENRTESRYGGNLDMNVKITDRLNTQILSTISRADIIRDYKNPLVGVEISSISRRLEENLFSLDMSMQYLGEKSASKAGLYYNTRTETNTSSRRFSISEGDFQNLQQLERLRDNSQNTTRFYAQSLYEIDDDNAIDAEFSISILRYNTPSERNNDDRDELTTISKLNYFHRFSDYLDWKISFEYFTNHFVYLKSEYSAQNRWNRILTLSQHFEYKSELVNYRPSLSLIANYTAFDYEALTQDVNSFSLRQINYSDTTQIFLTSKVRLESNLLVRYYERGLLFWDDFAETPESANFERFAKLLIIADREIGDSYGIGARVYSLNQERISSGLDQGFGAFQQFSYGPEVLLRLNFDSGSYISLTGWYEYQNTFQQGSQEVANIFLTSNIVF